MRFILCTVIVLFAAASVQAASLTPAQVQQIKQLQADVLKLKPELITALTDSSTKCSAVADAIAAGASRQRGIDQAVTELRTIPTASTLVSLSVQVQSGLKGLGASGAGIKSSCSDQLKRIDSLSRELDTAIADVKGAIQQVERDPSQGAVVISKVEALEARLAAAQQIIDEATKTMKQAEQPVSVLQKSVLSLKSEYEKKRPEDATNRIQDLLKGQLDSLSETSQQIAFELQAGMTKLAQAVALKASISAKDASTKDAIVANIRG